MHGKAMSYARVSNNISETHGNLKGPQLVNLSDKHLEKKVQFTAYIAHYVSPQVPTKISVCFLHISWHSLPDFHPGYVQRFMAWYVYEW